MYAGACVVPGNVRRNCVWSANVRRNCGVVRRGLEESVCAFGWKGLASARPTERPSDHEAQGLLAPLIMAISGTPGVGPAVWKRGSAIRRRWLGSVPWARTRKDRSLLRARETKTPRKNVAQNPSGT